MRRSILLLAGLSASVGCKVGPDYERPEYAAPDGFRNSGEQVEETTLGDLTWFEAFGDPVLQELVEQALAANYDLRMATERVLEARARVNITRADRYPEIQARAGWEGAKGTENGSNPIPPGVDPNIEEFSLIADLSWEIDFWGRIARATEAARAELLETEYAKQAVIQSLVTDLALAYFDLLELDAELEITRSTLESREHSYSLVELRLGQGVANRVELRQSENLVIQSAGLVPVLEQAIENQENLINLLLGSNPGPVPRGRPLLEQEPAAQIPVGLPSQLLERRPDVQVAEQRLIAANARIGEARARLFPTIRLTAAGGVASEDLGDLFSSGSDTWSILPSITQPIFNAGRLRSNVEVTESQQRQATLLYMQTLQQAFREVADALVAQEKSAEVRMWVERSTVALEDQSQLSNERYRGGVTSYLEVLDSERDYFDAQLRLAQAVRDELFAYVALYRALGGGWQGAVVATE